MRNLRSSCCSRRICRQRKFRPKIRRLQYRQRCCHDLRETAGDFFKKMFKMVLLHEVEGSGRAEVHAEAKEFPLLDILANTKRQWRGEPARRLRMLYYRAVFEQGRGEQAQRLRFLYYRAVFEQGRGEQAQRLRSLYYRAVFDTVITIESVRPVQLWWCRVHDSDIRYYRQGTRSSQYRCRQGCGLTSTAAVDFFSFLVSWGPVTTSLVPSQGGVLEQWALIPL